MLRCDWSNQIRPGVGHGHNTWSSWPHPTIPTSGLFSILWTAYWHLPWCYLTYSDLGQHSQSPTDLTLTTWPTLTSLNPYLVLQAILTPLACSAKCTRSSITMTVPIQAWPMPYVKHLQSLHCFWVLLRQKGGQVWWEEYNSKRSQAEARWGQGFVDIHTKVQGSTQRLIY